MVRILSLRSRASRNVKQSNQISVMISGRMNLVPFPTRDADRRQGHRWQRHAELTCRDGRHVFNSQVMADLDCGPRLYSRRRRENSRPNPARRQEFRGSLPGPTCTSSAIRSSAEAGGDLRSGPGTHGQTGEPAHPDHCGHPRPCLGGGWNVPWPAITAWCSTELEPSSACREIELGLLPAGAEPQRCRASSAWNVPCKSSSAATAQGQRRVPLGPRRCVATNENELREGIERLKSKPSSWQTITTGLLCEPGAPAHHGIDPVGRRLLLRGPSESCGVNWPNDMPARRKPLRRFASAFARAWRRVLKYEQEAAGPAGGQCRLVTI